MFLSRQLLQIAFFFLLISLLLLGVDYYLLVHFYGDLANWLVKPLGILEKLIIPLRILLLFSYFMMVTISSRMPRYSGPKYQELMIHKSIQWFAFFITIGCAYTFLNIEKMSISFILGYPASVVGIFIFFPLCGFLFPTKEQKLGSLVKRKKINNPDSINLKTKGRGWVNVTEPFRHTIVIAGSGSGKTESVVRPYMSQFIEKGFCGILYDYKFPTLTNELNTILIQNKRKANLPLYVLDFENVSRCHRVNPIRADYIKEVSYAEEIATSIYNNLDLSSVKHNGNFFTRSAINWFTAIIWFYKVKHPEQCTLPHVFNTILYQDYQHVFSMLLSEDTSGDYIRSIVTSLDTKADRQLGGQVASLQNVIARLNTPKLAWILSGNDFDLDINNPEDPKLLSVGMSPQIRKSLAPVISCIFTVALQQMNVEGKHKSFLMLDEATTLYLDDLDHIGAVARSNKIAMVLIAQDTAMLVEKYGLQKAQTIIANMNNMYFGRTNLPQTAKIVSETIGKEEREIISKNEGTSYHKYDQGNLSHGFSVQERAIVKPEEVQTLKKGEFVGRSTDEAQNYFFAKFKRHRFRTLYTLEPFVEFLHQKDNKQVKDRDIVINQNLDTIKSEVKSIVNSYKNVYADAGTSLTSE
ncbi:pyrimidine operon attenuation protein/uracil phosphoribosyltransferase [Catalinimonas alkaloidigena]|nr:pyrimidine operon attenuation protein/uracil phosphoribosyltransferase [Catalinimonas alkaloidigena]